MKISLAVLDKNGRRNFETMTTISGLTGIDEFIRTQFDHPEAAVEYMKNDLRVSLPDITDGEIVKVINFSLCDPAFFPNPTYNRFKNGVTRFR